MKRIDMTGKRFNRWTVLSYVYTIKGRAYWKCRCDCGTIKAINSQQLRFGKSKSCGCYKREKSRLNKGEASFNELYCNYKSKARRVKRTFLLSKEDFKNITSQPCYYCGKIPEQKAGANDRHYGAYIYNGIDRVDNDRGYELGNCVPCCIVCNRMKLTLAQKEFLEHIERIYKKQFEVNNGPLR
jgi:hypothetical protein